MSIGLRLIENTCAFSFTFGMLMLASVRERSRRSPVGLARPRRGARLPAFRDPFGYARGSTEPGFSEPEPFA